MIGKHGACRDILLRALPHRILAAALALLLAPALPAAAQDRLAAGESLALRLDPARPVQLRIEAPPGSYLAGRIEAGAQPVDAALLTAEGAHFRQLAQQDRGAIRFQAMSEGEAMILRLSGAGETRVALDQLVAPADLQPPAPDYLSPRMAALAETLAQGGDTAGFWRAVAAEGTPLVEEAEAGEVVLTFLWRGAQRNVRLFGGPSSDHDWLDRLGDSDVWFKSFRVPRTTRLSYKLAPDVPDLPGNARARRMAILATAQMDPLNRHPWPAEAPDRFNQHATLTLPQAPPQPGTPPAPEADPAMRRVVFDSPTLGNSRELLIAHPRDFDPADPRLVLALIFDGERALAEMQAPQMLDTLTRQGRLPPVLAVLIPSIDGMTRARELPGNDTFADALADELLPLIAAETGITPDPARTVLAGASYGGLAAATVALRRSDRFGNALSMSGSFWWAPQGSASDGTPHVAAEFAARDRLPIRFFLSAGSFETSRHGGDGILQTSRSLRDILRLKGYAVDWREYAGGHDYLVWRGALADGLIALFGAR